MSEEGVKVRDVFKHRGRACVVVRMGLRGMGEYHNGYVSVAPRHRGKHYNDFISRIKTDELTFGGGLSHLEDKRIPKAYFLRFDSMHYWNDKNPISKTFGMVRKRTIELANEMVDKGI